MLGFKVSAAVWAITVGVAAAAILGYGAYQHKTGKEEVRAEWNASIERGKARIARLEARAASATRTVEIRYIDRVQTVYEKGREIERVREVYVPANSGTVSGGFRVYHDAAAANEVPDAAGIANAPAVPVETVAETVAYNYEQCHKAFAMVKGWQDWAAEQCKLNKDGCPPNG